MALCQRQLCTDCAHDIPALPRIRVQRERHICGGCKFTHEPLVQTMPEPQFRNQNWTPPSKHTPMSPERYFKSGAGGTTTSKHIQSHPQETSWLSANLKITTRHYQYSLTVCQQTLKIPPKIHGATGETSIGVLSIACYTLQITHFDSGRLTPLEKECSF